MARIGTWRELVLCQYKYKKSNMMHGIRIEHGNGGIYNFLVNITYAAFCKLAFSIDEFKINKVKYSVFVSHSFDRYLFHGRIVV